MDHRIALSCLSLVGAVVAAACGGAVGSSESSGDSHASTPGAAATTPGAAATTPGAAAPTPARDAPKHQRPSARTCIALATPDGGVDGGGDECLQDADCGDHGVCECGYQRFGTEKPTNRCLPDGNCRTSSDCTGGEVCVLSSPLGVPFGSRFYAQTWGYFCTTNQDSCRNDEDCATVQHDHQCVYFDPTTGFPPANGGWGCGGGP